MNKFQLKFNQLVKYVNDDLTNNFLIQGREREGTYPNVGGIWGWKNEPQISAERVELEHGDRTQVTNDKDCKFCPGSTLLGPSTLVPFKLTRTKNNCGITSL